MKFRAATSDFFSINAHLRLVLDAVERVFGTTLDKHETGRLFREAEVDQVSAKQYVLLDDERARIAADVDEYEPETVRLTIHTSRVYHGRIESLFECASLVLGTGASHRSVQETEFLFRNATSGIVPWERGSL